MALKGQKAHSDRLKRMTGNPLIRAAGRVVFVGADMIRAEAFRGISAGSVSGKGHVPSAPGEYPNRDTGGLNANIENNQTGPISAEVRSKAEYAAPLEYGTSKMAARPYMRPARDSQAPKIQKLFAREIEKLIKGAG